MGSKPSKVAPARTEVLPVQTASGVESGPQVSGHSSSNSSLTGGSYPQSPKHSSRPNSLYKNSRRGQRAATPFNGTHPLRSAELVMATNHRPSSRPHNVRTVHMVPSTPQSVDGNSPKSAPPNAVQGEYFDPLKLDTSLDSKREAIPSNQRRRGSSRIRRGSSALGCGSGERRDSNTSSFDNIAEMKCILDSNKIAFLKCPTCNQTFTLVGFAVPHLLHCGHTYCSSCLEKALETTPSALRCGLCSTNTLVEGNSLSLPKNSIILEMLNSKKLTQLMCHSKRETCAECEQQLASLYCNLCRASFCDFCSQQAHQGSKVRSKHRPLPIRLKPCTQPTCLQHAGQTCLLYCETEQTPMCVLCKFYGQHRFHSYELLNQAANRYVVHLSEQIHKANNIDKVVMATMKEAAYSSEHVVESALKCEEQLERHFGELKRDLVTALERREAILLAQLDRQVEMQQDILQSKKEELAFMRTLVLAAIEEADQLLHLDPVTALMERDHVDQLFQQVLGLQVLGVPPEDTLSISLPPEASLGLSNVVSSHGIVLQLPPKLRFVNVVVLKERILLQWSVVTSAGVLPQEASPNWTFTVECYTHLPKGHPSRHKQANSLSTPSHESGYEDISTGPSGSVSMVTVGSLRGPSLPSAVSKSRENPHSPTKELREEDISTLELDITNDQKMDNVRSNEKSKTLLSEAIRLPKPTEPKQVNSSDMLPALNRSPLARHTHDDRHRRRHICHTGSDSDSSGVYADSEESVTKVTNMGNSLGLPPLRTSPLPKGSGVVSNCNLSDPTWVGRSFVQIYNGKDQLFTLKGIHLKAKYYFRVRCYNSTGWGPWSDVIKCYFNK